MFNLFDRVTPYRVNQWKEVDGSPGEMEPDFLKPVESRGEQVTMKESGREDLQLKVIPANLN